MTSFEKTVQVGNRSLHFSFDPIAYPRGIKYYVKVKAGQRVIDCFEVKHNDGAWNAIPPCPKWVQKNARVLSELINTASTYSGSLLQR